MFQVPAKTQYAIRALVHLARRGEDSAARIAEAQMISPKYLEGILGQLKAAGIVVSGRGRMGGYRLAKDPAHVKMLEVVEATEGEVRPVDCLDSAASCILGGSCMPRRFWLGLKSAVDEYLSSVSLGDLANERFAEEGEGLDHPSRKGVSL
ncbi:MAG TPA: Rrf2 family transcriptional regulator [Rectinemataceae bacterium]